ncbi:MAG: GNAT family N-acetyltransferase [Pseudomonadota bacterium]
MITIRLYTDSDAPFLASIFRDSVRVLGRRAYTRAQVRAWLQGTPDATETRARCSDGRTTFVADDGSGQPVGFIDLEPDGHIDLFYVAPDVAGQGVAKSLYNALETVAVRDGLERLYVEASEVAKGFFDRQGFIVSKRRDFDIQGVPIHNYAMEKTLGP